VPEVLASFDGPWTAHQRIVRIDRFVVAFCVAVSGAGPAGAAATGRGTATRLAKAQLLRKVRASLLPSSVEAASSASWSELRHLISPNLSTVADYQPYARLVFLSDGDPQLWDSLAEPIAEQFPDKLVVKGDVDIHGEHHDGNLTAMHIDNTARLPLANGSADLVLMRRGMCLCHGGKMCGGLHPDVPAMRRFFGEVYRLLDPSNSKAVAYLHGAYGPAERVEVFRKAADELMVRNPKMKIELVSDQIGFNAVRITHASSAKSTVTARRRKAGRTRAASGDRADPSPSPRA
jgi:hypothetical protein